MAPYIPSYCNMAMHNMVKDMEMEEAKAAENITMMAPTTNHTLPAKQVR